MKKLLVVFSIAIMGICNNNVYAQTNSQTLAGIYMTPADFQEQKLTYQIDCSDANNKIKTNEFWGSSTGYVLSKGEKHAFDKNKVYGYRSCKNKFYRFVKGETYQVLDTASFYIYYQYKSEENTKGKGLVKKDEYYFSKNPGGDLMLLTLENLKKAFPENHRFRYALEANINSDKELIAYDNYLKEYKIKYLYNQSLK